MNKFRAVPLTVFILFTLFLPSGMVKAQTISASGPVYIVKLGDSLWDIAYRFHVSQQALASANGIINTDQISIGESLVIPGLEGIQGVLSTENVTYGETLHSLSLRYQIPVGVLERLNHLTSPNELYAGYSLVILQKENPSTSGKRAALGAGQSLLELAVLNDTDLWTILAGNQLDNSTRLLPGDVFRVPGKQDSGPGAIPPEITTLKISSIVQGKTAEIQIEGSDGLSSSGFLVDHPLNFFQNADGHYYALQGVDSRVEPGLYPVDLHGDSPTGLPFDFSQMVLITSGNYSSEYITNVDPLTLDPTVTKPEDQLWSQLSSPVSPEKLWEGLFSLPVDQTFAGCYSSWFGTRRSYNGSPFNYVHTGQDFCGQEGNPIYAAAAGVVVYTGHLTVRGNATMIDHGWGVYSAYMHQSEILVNVGDRVEQGQLIGRVGRTGRVEGPHLHFEVIVGGVQVDPLEWLNQVFP